IHKVLDTRTIHDLSQQEVEVYRDEIGTNRIELMTLRINHNIRNGAEFNVNAKIYAEINIDTILIDEYNFIANTGNQSEATILNINNNNMPAHVVNRVYVVFSVSKIDYDEQSDDYIVLET
ncbi:16674_t:CDS:1, partial [Racocetra fulgida]